MSEPRPRLCFVTTSPLVVQFFLVPHLRALSERFDTTLVANADCSQFLGPTERSVRMMTIPVERDIAPVSDMLALGRLTSLFRRERFDAVISIAPKAGLLAQVAARIAGIPYRCHIFQGEVWASRHGAMRALLRTTDRIVAGAATQTLVVSHSERAFLIGDGILRADRSTVLGRGSICGVETSRFAPDPARRDLVRQMAGIPPDALVLLFLGRLHPDKGVLDLVTAWLRLADNHPHLHLALVGPDEGGLVERVQAMVGPNLAPRLHITGMTTHPEHWLAAADILSLPSYREGFGNVIIEAGATQLPVIVSRIYGTADAFVEGETGLGHPPGDPVALQGCIERLINEPELRRNLGREGRRIVLRDFEQTVVVQRYCDHFFNHVGRRSPAAT
jgi:glycosyltransferase involved in cell wall biosynthesis